MQDEAPFCHRSLMMGGEPSGTWRGVLRFGITGRQGIVGVQVLGVISFFTFTLPTPLELIQPFPIPHSS